MGNQDDVTKRDTADTPSETMTSDAEDTEVKDRARRDSFDNNKGKGIWVTAARTYNRRLPVYGWALMYDDPVGPVQLEGVTPPLYVPRSPTCRVQSFPTVPTILRKGFSDRGVRGRGFDSRDLDKRIINGQPSSPGEHPYICSLQLLRSGMWYHLCGSVIFNSNTVVTAGHCVSGFDVSSLRVVCGEYNLKTNDNTEQIRDVTSAKVHPSYSTNGNAGFPNDIALIELSAPLNFNTDVNRIQFDDGRRYISTSCTLSGWGRTYSGLPDRLHDVSVRRIYNYWCGRYWGRSRIGSGHICFKDWGRYDGPCNGDSGGPAVCGKVMVGVTSWGIQGCRSRYYPAVYTRVSAYYSWISSNAF